MIQVDAKECSREIRAFADDAKLRLLGMLKNFVEDVAGEAIDNTPHGDLDASGSSGHFDEKMGFYVRRKAAIWSLQIQPGLAKGNWYVTTNSENASFDDKSYDDIYGSLSRRKIDFSVSQLKLGDTVNIVNPTPYVVRFFGPEGSRPLEQGFSEQAPEGISKPTIDAVMSIYSLNLQYYYDNAKGKK